MIYRYVIVPCFNCPESKAVIWLKQLVSVLMIYGHRVRRLLSLLPDAMRINVWSNWWQVSKLLNSEENSLSKIALILYDWKLLGPERMSHNNNSAAVIYGSGATTDAVFYPSCMEDIPKVCEWRKKLFFII